MGRDIYQPLNEINAVVDAGDAMARHVLYKRIRTEGCAERCAIAALERIIEAAELPAERSRRCSHRPTESGAFQAPSHDSQILRAMSVVTATETLTEQLADFMENEEQAQLEAQAD
jgi:uncharacterized protein related to proFAR isomerase